MQILCLGTHSHTLPHTPTHSYQVTNKDLVHTLEGGVVTWTSQIKAVLDRSHEDSIKQGLNPTPDEEVKFWADAITFPPFLQSLVENFLQQPRHHISFSCLQLVLHSSFCNECFQLLYKRIRNGNALGAAGHFKSRIHIVATRPIRITAAAAHFRRKVIQSLWISAASITPTAPT